jgi:hypothetical protein
MFPHPINKGYDDPNGFVIKEVDGIAIKNLKHFVEVLRDGRTPQVSLKFAKMSNRMQENMIFDRREMLAATEDILKDFGIRYPYSDDLRPVWEMAHKQ